MAKGTAINEKKPSASKCLANAGMLVPKFAYEQSGGWFIQWPRDLPEVTRAETKEDLIVKLAARLMEIGRVTNQGTHVPPEFH